MRFRDQATLAPQRSPSVNLCSSGGGLGNPKFEVRGKNCCSLIACRLGVAVISGLIYVLIFGLQGSGPVARRARSRSFSRRRNVLATIFITVPFVARD